MKKLLPIVIILAVVGAGGAVFYANRPEKEPTVNTLQMSRGDIIDGVGATGTLQAVTHRHRRHAGLRHRPGARTPTSTRS